MNIDYDGFVVKLDKALIERSQPITTDDDSWTLLHTFDYFLTVEETVLNIIRDRSIPVR